MSAFLLTAGLVADVTGGQLVAGAADRVFTEVVTDSRTMQASAARGVGGALFVALSGPTFDGNDFVPDVIEKGAAGLLVSRRPVDARDCAVILVDDTTIALQRLGHAVRMRSGARVVAITGSAGKTSTKEATAALLEARYRVFRTAGNLNNHIGLPLSLIQLRHGADIGVFELGMNHAGEIRTLVGLARPDVRVWTNVGPAHIGHFGSLEAIAEAKAEVLEDASSATVAVLNADDPLVMRHGAGFVGRVLTFGIRERADVQAVVREDRGFDGTVADVNTPWGPLSLALELPGRVNLLNVLAASTVALEAGVSPDDVQREAAGLAAVPRRGHVATVPSGARVIDDSYNASPSAVCAALDALRRTPSHGRRIAVLGEMLELGEDARRWHEVCGRAAAEARVDALVVVGGPAADGLVAGACAAGLASDLVYRVASSLEAAPVVAELVGDGDVVLVKGSRGTRTDIVVDYLRGNG
jgi:UDP-N-acetylmuramoyl-tripeptide--D-alanyl-D-alanine ligase